MQILRWFYITLVLLLPVNIQGAVVVAHPDVDPTITTLNRTMVRAIFTGSITRWRTGAPIIVYVLPFDHPSTKSFVWDTLRITPYAFEERINSMIATRDGNVPIKVPSEAEMLRQIRFTPNSIGYISSNLVVHNASTTVRILPVR